jgi:hypothetical protein
MGQLGRILNEIRPGPQGLPLTPRKISEIRRTTWIQPKVYLAAAKKRSQFMEAQVE